MLFKFCTLFGILSWCHAIDDLQKFDCHTDADITENACQKRGCVWEKSDSTKNIPSCFYDPTNKYGYTYVNETTVGSLHKVFLRRKIVGTTDVFPDPANHVVIQFEEQTKTRLQVKIYDQMKVRYEVPFDQPHQEISFQKDSIKSSFDYNIKKKMDFSFKIFAKRGNNAKVVIWDTDAGTMMLHDQFLQLSTRLPSTYVYGIGETSRSTYRIDFSSWRSQGLFSRDQAPYPEHNVNLYGVHPMYMCLEEDGSAHGVLLLNSNAMDITVQPTPALTYRTIGGVLDFYFFLGPTPEDVVKQYTEFIGRPVMPAYWSLGFQLCRYGYNSLDEVKRTVSRMAKYDIPQDVQYGDIDYMERQLDFTYDNSTYFGLPEYVREIKRKGIKYITILDPAISAEEPPGTYEPYDLGTKLDVWIKDETGKDAIIGKVWPDKPGIFVNTSWPWDEQTKYFRANATFPDWFHPNIASWWSHLIKKFHKTIEFDGLWIDMNEVANFVKGSLKGCPESNTFENPPYKPKILNDLSDKTLCMSAKHADDEIEYNYHSLYGWKQSIVTRAALSETTGKRGIVISRSTFPSSGRYVGHWLGDNKSEWPQMHESIIGMMDFSLFGISYTGADICGFNEDTTYELCLRWTQLGAFYPMSRNHNGLGFKPQDPAVFGAEFARLARVIIRVRYELLPLLYTLMYSAHTRGSTVVRPMLHVFPNDKTTWDIDTQFFWGDQLLISPVLKKGETSTEVYLPKNHRWYDYFTKNEIVTSGKKFLLKVPMDKIGLHVRGGVIIPLQEPASNTKASRANPMRLLVAMDAHFEARGNLFWDDGELLNSISIGHFLFLDFVAKQGSIQINVKRNGYEDSVRITMITVLGVEDQPIESVTVDGIKHERYTYGNKRLVVSDLSLAITRNHNIEWKTSSSSTLKSVTILCWLIVFTSYIVMQKVY